MFEFDTGSIQFLHYKTPQLVPGKLWAKALIGVVISNHCNSFALGVARDHRGDLVASTRQAVLVFYDRRPPADSERRIGSVLGLVVLGPASQLFPIFCYPGSKMISVVNPHNLALFISGTN